jgi:hypothetical protein
MINLETFFKNHFDSNKLSDNKVKKFAEIHIQRLAAHNDANEFTDMINDTTSAYEGYFGAITDEDTKNAMRQSLTKTKDLLFANIKKLVSQKEGIIAGSWGKDSPVYQEFFPYGKTEYGQATLANIDQLMERFIQACGRHQAALPTGFGVEFQNLHNQFKAARTSQLHMDGKVEEGRTISSTTRDVLEIQLMKNLLNIAAMFIGKVERCNDFFDQSFLRKIISEEEEEPVMPEE